MNERERLVQNLRDAVMTHDKVRLCIEAANLIESQAAELTSAQADVKFNLDGWNSAMQQALANGARANEAQAKVAELRDALETAAGMVMVPVEPTDAILTAGGLALGNHIKALVAKDPQQALNAKGKPRGLVIGWKEKMAIRYKAMIVAAKEQVK